MMRRREVDRTRERPGTTAAAPRQAAARLLRFATTLTGDPAPPLTVESTMAESQASGHLWPGLGGGDRRSDPRVGQAKVMAEQVGPTPQEPGPARFRTPRGARPCTPRPSPGSWTGTRAARRRSSSPAPARRSGRNSACMSIALPIGLRRVARCGAVDDDLPHDVGKTG